MAGSVLLADWPEPGDGGAGDGGQDRVPGEPPPLPQRSLPLHRPGLPPGAGHSCCSQDRNHWQKRLPIKITGGKYVFQL